MDEKVLEKPESTAERNSIWQRGFAIFSHPQRVWTFVGILVAVALIGKGLALLGIVSFGDFPRVPQSKWQAVFLVNGQVYFGHLESYNRNYARLKDVYYLRAANALQQGQEQAPALNLVKLGSELHGPEDAMFVPKERILFWENMKTDAQVVQAIESTRK